MNSSTVTIPAHSCLTDTKVLCHKNNTVHSPYPNYTSQHIPYVATECQFLSLPKGCPRCHRPCALIKHIQELS